MRSVEPGSPTLVDVCPGLRLGLRLPDPAPPPAGSGSGSPTPLPLRLHVPSASRTVGLHRENKQGLTHPSLGDRSRDVVLSASLGCLKPCLFTGTISHCCVEVGP